MSAFHDNALMGASGSQGYQISRSVRLRSSASAYFNRTPAGAGNRKTWTFSFWHKRGAIADCIVFGSRNAGTTTVGYIGFQSDKFDFQFGSSGNRIQDAAVRRDPSAWAHFHVVCDTPNATSTDRMQLWVNGVRVTSFSQTSYPTQNADSDFNVADFHAIGRYGASASNYVDGYLTEVNFIDGQALTPSSFGETDSLTGVWKPKKYAGSYGTNGFYLNFSDNSAATAATIGKDYSGNGNNWTPNNISITAGATYDSMLDVPTPYADGGNGRGNYAVLNPLWKSVSGNGTFYDGNLSYYSVTNAYWQNAEASIAVSSGKWYWEVVQTAGYSPSGSTYVGIAPAVWTGAWPGADASSYAFYTGDGKKYNSGTGATYGSTCVNGDVIGVALDLDSGTLAFYKNGTAIGTAYTGISGTFAPVIAVITNSSVVTYSSVNCGQRPFAYTPPSGFKALNTQNLPEPTIKKGNQYFDVSTWTGTNSTGSRTITGLGFQPDLIWGKDRTSAFSHQIYDSVRGTGKSLISNSTAAEDTTNISGYISAFNSDGFTATVGSTDNWYWNKLNDAYVAWQWKESATAGFDIVTYTGNGTAGRTISHSLGVAPAMMIVKSRSSGTEPWRVYHKNMAASPATVYMNLSDSGASVVSSTRWNDTAPTSSVFTVGSDSSVNANGATYVAYLFSEVAGFSRMGSYQGNGSTDGPFVFCGFKPRFIMFKRTDSTGSWEMYDTARGTYNQVEMLLEANNSNAEYTSAPGGYSIDMLSNGFKIRGTGASYNASGGTFIFAAFAESPFKTSLAR